MFLYPFHRFKELEWITWVNYCNSCMASNDYLYCWLCVCQTVFKCFLHSNLFSPQNNPVKWGLLRTLFYRQGNRVTEKPWLAQPSSSLDVLALRTITVYTQNHQTIPLLFWKADLPAPLCFRVFCFVFYFTSNAATAKSWSSGQPCGWESPSSLESELSSSLFMLLTG